MEPDITCLGYLPNQTSHQKEAMQPLQSKYNRYLSGIINNNRGYNKQDAFLAVHKIKVPRFYRYR